MQRGQVVIRFALLFFTINFFESSLAEALLRPEQVAVKYQLEETLVKRYRERISTQVPLELFNVSANVEFDLDKSFSSEKKSNDLPADISLGIIDSFNSEFNANGSTSKFTLKKIEITVGLHEKLGPEYESKFKTWMKDSIRSEFGKIGVAKFSKIAPIPKPEVEVKSEPPMPRNLTFEEKVGNYQNFAGLALLSLFLVAAMLLMKLLPSRDLREQMNVALRIQEMKNAQLDSNIKTQLPFSDKKNETSPELQLSANLLFDSLREHQRKISLVAISNANLINRAIEFWLDDGLDGKKKIASLIDSFLAYVDMKSASFSENMNWSLPEIIKKDKELPEIFRTFANYSLSEKVSLAEKAYWDLLSVKTFDDQIRQTPFASVSHLSSNRITQLLSNQDKKIKTVALLHLPQQKMEQVVSEMNFDDKKNLVLHALDMAKIHPKDLELADESLRFLVKQQDAKDDSFIEIQSLVPQMLMCLDAHEELKLIQDIITRLSDRGHYLKLNYPSIAFLQEWPEEKYKVLVNSCQTYELLSLIKTMPDLTKKTFDILPNRTQVILKDSISKELSQEEIIRGLNDIKIKIFRLVNDGQVVLSRIFASENNSTSKAA